MDRTDTLELAGHIFSALSGGEQTRVIMARVFAQAAPLVLLDESTTALDVAHQKRVLGEMRQLASDGACVIAVLHDLNAAAFHADRMGRGTAGARPRRWERFESSELTGRFPAGPLSRWDTRAPAESLTKLAYGWRTRWLVVGEIIQTRGSPMNIAAAATYIDVVSPNASPNTP